METFRGEVVWTGEVEVLELEEHPTASRCFAWKHAPGEGRERVVAVLGDGTIQTAHGAVRAAIVAGHKARNSDAS